MIPYATLGALVLIASAAVQRFGVLDGLAITAAIWLLMPYDCRPPRKS